MRPARAGALARLRRRELRRRRLPSARRRVYDVRCRGGQHFGQHWPPSPGATSRANAVLVVSLMKWPELSSSFTPYLGAATAIATHMQPNRAGKPVEESGRDGVDPLRKSCKGSLSGATHVRAGKHRFWIAPRRSSVRVRLAPFSSGSPVTFGWRCAAAVDLERALGGANQPGLFRPAWLESMRGAAGSRRR
jgi:hypothetical protein